MKILLINDYSTPTGGAEIYVLQLRSLLRAAGHDARLIASSVGDEKLRQADTECWGSSGKIVNRLLQTFNPFALVKLRKVLRSFEPEVVHINMFLTQLSPSILSLLQDVPVVHTAHTYRLVCPLGTKLLPARRLCERKSGRACLEEGCLSAPLWAIDMLQRALVRRYAGALSVVQGVSHYMQRQLTAGGVATPRVQSNFLSAEPHDIPFPAGAPTASYLGRLVPEKGVDVLLNAMRRVRRSSARGPVDRGRERARGGAAEKAVERARSR